MTLSSPLVYAIIVTCVLLVWVIMYIILQRSAMRQVQQLAEAVAARKQAAATVSASPVQVHIMTPSIAPPAQPPLSRDGAFQQIGTLYQGGTDNRQVLPLFGASVNRGRKWNYFTQTDGYTAIKLPVRAKNKDCLDEWGCDELEDGDEVVVEELGATFKVKKYARSAFIYNPIVGGGL